MIRWRRLWAVGGASLLVWVCAIGLAISQDLQTYFDQRGRSDVVSGGVRMIPIETPHGTFRVWTKRTGNNPQIKVLLLHGGPGATHQVDFSGLIQFLRAVAENKFKPD